MMNVQGDTPNSRGSAKYKREVEVNEIEKESPSLLKYNNQYYEVP